MRSTIPRVHARWKFLFAVLLLVAIAAFAFSRSEQIKNKLDRAVVFNNSKASILLDMRIGAMQRINEFRKLTRLTDSKGMQAQAELVKKHAGTYFEVEAKLSKVLNSSPDTSKDELNFLRRVTETGIAAAPVVAKIQQLALDNKAREVGKVVQEELAHGPVKTWLNAVNDMIAFETELTAHAANLASIAYEQLRILVLSFSALAVILGLTAGWFTLSKIAPADARAKA
jgi:hypothetical protein